MKEHNNRIQSLATLQFAAVIAIVLAHFWIENATFLQALCTSFCFVYSGYFTARTHRFNDTYRLADHARYMRDKLAKLYPLHLLALALCLLAGHFYWKADIVLYSKVMLAHLLLISPWFSSPSFYFGVNPVSWFICVLFFLYLIAPFIIKALRCLRLGWQVAIVGVLTTIELVAGYAQGPGSPSLLIPDKAHYFLYEFPIIRILDFTAGIVLCHLTRSAAWSRLTQRLTPASATLVELGGIVLFIVLYILGENMLHPHWYRAFVSAAPAALTLLAAFVFTSGKAGLVSRTLSVPPLPLLSATVAEVYLLQFALFYIVKALAQGMGLPTQGTLYFIIQNGVLLLTAWAVHHGFVMPLYRWLKAGKTSH